MKAFEIVLNGRKLCTAGVGSRGVLTAVLTWVGREGENTQNKSPNSLKEEPSIEEELMLDVGGLVSPVKEHVRWAQTPLHLGDEVSIRIVDVESVDLPSDRKTEDPSEDVRRQQEYVERMAQRFGWTVQK